MQGYTLVRRFNNNIVEARDMQDRRLVLSGKGIGFGVRPGDTIPESAVSVRYVPETDRDIQRILALLADVPPVLSVVARHAARRLEASTAFEIALADHLAGAVRRYQRGQDVSLPLYFEVTQLYPRELEFGHWVLKLVHAKLGVRLPEQEAAAIALHAVNEQISHGTGSVSDVMTFTRTIDAVLNYLHERCGIELDHHDAAVTRFITHMRYLFHRLQARTPVEPGPEQVVTAIRESLASSWQLSGEVAALIREHTGFELSESEQAYVALHIGRFVHQH